MRRMFRDSLPLWTLSFLAIFQILGGDARRLDMSLKCPPGNFSTRPQFFAGDGNGNADYIAGYPGLPNTFDTAEYCCHKTEDSTIDVSKQPSCLGNISNDEMTEFDEVLREVDLKRQMYSDDGVLIYSRPYRIQFQTPRDSRPNFGGSERKSGTNTSVSRRGADCDTLIRNKHRHLDVPGLIECAGFDSRNYTVVTEDGYILTLFRIINTNRRINASLPPVLFQHGLFGTAADWLMLDQKDNLPFICASSGFDVWLGNARGSHYSLRHKFMDSKTDFRYWDFTHHEMGIYDLPAVFDFIINFTKKRKTNQRGTLYYVGHSLGTTMFYVCMSTHWKKYNNLIEGMVAIPPSAYLSRNTSPLRSFSPLADLYKAFPVQGPLTPESLTSYFHFYLPELCRFKFMNQSVCTLAVFFLAGASPKDINPDVIRRVLEHYPSGLSIKNAIHLLQSVQKDSFQQFDYGPAKNFKAYNQTTPPRYNLYNIFVRTMNVYGREDLIVDRVDSEQNVAELGAGKLKTNVLVMDYNHIDLIWSKSAAPVINHRIVTFLSTIVVQKSKEIISDDARPSKRECHCTCRLDDRGDCAIPPEKRCEPFKPGQQ